MRAVDDVWHFIYDCPALQHLRLGRQNLFSGTQAHDMAAFMKQRDQEGVFFYVLQCLREVTAHLTLDRSHDVDLGLNQPVDFYDSD